jgi:tetratricopeptide (TPR) repeat protein
LAELNFEQGKYREAREALNRAIASRADSVHAFYLRAKSSLEMGEYAVAIPDLEYVVAKDPKFDYYRQQDC